jgi:uracil-DNA glycosylase family 4
MPEFDPGCVRCPRLSTHLNNIRREYPDYHARPVAPFGAADPWLLIVGLAPGMHGANATGRPFTGDYAGILLYKTLHEFGFSNQPHATDRKDRLKLFNCRITNAVKCLPPENKPTGGEIRMCNDYLRSELGGLRRGALILALGKVAHDAVLRALDVKLKQYPFRHGAQYRLTNGSWLIDSYHCSRYNTQTRRLTGEMFTEIFKKILEIYNISI